jgi:hypothetical protein
MPIPPIGSKYSGDLDLICDASEGLVNDHIESLESWGYGLGNNSPGSVRITVRALEADKTACI